jgi:hypothetical protein
VGLVRSVLPDAYAAKARGLVLCAMTMGSGYVYYLAFDADDAIPPAAADAISHPPVVKAQPINSPMHAIPAEAQHQPAGAIPADRTAVARDLQAVLARAHCYDGPIDGEWTAASQQAASAFLAVIHRELPVRDPGPALLSLAAANAGATCPVKLPLYTGTLAAEDSKPSAGERSMLDQPWAAPEMLAPPKPEISSAVSSQASITVSDAEPLERDAPPPSASLRAAQEPSSRVAPPTTVSPATSEPALRFEGGNVVSDTKPDTTSQPLPARKVAHHKAKSTKRRMSRRHDDSSFGVSFDSIQKSISSLF